MELVSIFRRNSNEDGGTSTGFVGVGTFDPIGAGNAGRFLAGLIVVVSGRGSLCERCEAMIETPKHLA